VKNLMTDEQIESVVKQTMVGGATLTGLLGTSAWMAPGAAAASVAEAVIKDQKKMIPCSVALEGEYGIKDLTIGAPCIIGRNGIEAVCEVKLSDKEAEQLRASEAAVRKTTAVLHEMKLI
jgi:malate dehydrogenase